MKRFLTVRWLVPLAIMLLLASVLLPVYNNVNLLTPETKLRMNLGDIWLNLQEYARDHEGKFPTSLAELGTDYPVWPNARQFHDVANGKPSDWLYFPGHATSDPPTTILVACPVALRERAGFLTSVEERYIATVGAPTERMTEAEFQQRLKTQTPHQ